MQTIEVSILSDQDEALIMSVLRAFESQDRVSLKLQNDSSAPVWQSGSPLSEGEWKQTIDTARVSRSYSFDEAKQFLGL